MLSRALLIIVFCGSFMSAALAQGMNMDAGLYAPDPPSGSAFIRFMQMDAGQESLQAVMNKRDMGMLAYGTISPYQVQPQGDVTLGFGRALLRTKLEAGKFYSVFAYAGHMDVREDPLPADRTKAQVLFYNFTEHAALDLKTADGKIDIIKGIAPKQNGERAINPVKLGFSAYSNKDRIAQSDEQALDRGQSYALIARPDQPLLFIKAQTASEP